MLYEQTLTILTIYEIIFNILVLFVWSFYYIYNYIINIIKQL